MLKVLYICTHNRCRSILFEALTNQLSDGTIKAKSAGSQPSKGIHPLTRQYLEHINVEGDQFYSKCWSTMEDFNPDLIITVCDNAANESCPLWIGNQEKVHWPIKDPSNPSNNNHSDTGQKSSPSLADNNLAAFDEAANIMINKINAMKNIISETENFENNKSDCLKKIKSL